MKHAIFSIFIFSVFNSFSQSPEHVYVQAFSKMFGSVDNQRWNATEEGSTVKFEQNNIRYHVFYNKRGRWKATIKQLPVGMVPRWVTSRVKYEFRNYSIFFAQNVCTPVGQTYILKIEKGSEWKTVMISPAATEVVGEYVRN